MKARVLYMVVWHRPTPVAGRRAMACWGGRGWLLCKLKRCLIFSYPPPQHPHYLLGKVRYLPTLRKVSLIDGQEVLKQGASCWERPGCASGTTFPLPALSGRRVNQSTRDSVTSRSPGRWLVGSAANAPSRPIHKPLLSCLWVTRGPTTSLP
jgi:hypothetical protein